MPARSEPAGPPIRPDLFAQCADGGHVPVDGGPCHCGARLAEFVPAVWREVAEELGARLRRRGRGPEGLDEAEVNTLERFDALRSEGNEG